MSDTPKFTALARLPETEAANASRLPAHQLFNVADALPIASNGVELLKLQEIIDILWLRDDGDQEKCNAQIVRAIGLFESLAPTDGAEAMLAIQMVGTHHAIVELMWQAAKHDQSLEARDKLLNQVNRLMKSYMQQMAALDRHRGKGQQHITVERVQVAAGGQAIVGHVEATSERAAPGLAGNVTLPVGGKGS